MSRLVDLWAFALRVSTGFFWLFFASQRWLDKRTTSLAPSRDGVIVFKILNSLKHCGIQINRHIPESQVSGRRGKILVRDRGNGLKAQPAVYRWTNGAGWAIPTSCEVMRVKAVNREPVIRPEGTLAL